MYIYIYINTYVYFFSFPPFISRFLFSIVSAPIYDLNCFKPRDPCNRKSTRDVCGQDVVHYFLFHLAIANADWSFPNLMFFSSLPEKRESFPRFSPPPSFRIDPITPKIRQFYLFHLIYFSFFRILGLERRKENRCQIVSFLLFF